MGDDNNNKKAVYNTAGIAGASPPLPFHLQFLSGAAAGIFEVLMMYPLDGKFETSFSHFIWIHVVLIWALLL